MNRVPLYLALLAAAAGASSWFLAELERSLRQTQERDDSTPVLSAENYAATKINAAGEREYTLVGPHLERLPGERGTFFDAPLMHTFENRAEVWEIRAERAWAAPHNDVIELREAVRAERPASTGQKPVRLDTRDLRLVPNQDYGETAAPVRVETPEGVATGVGARVWLAEDRIELLSHVRGTYEPPHR